MDKELDFEIVSGGRISTEFLKRKIRSFYDAQKFVRSLPYSRNTDKTNPATVFTDKCGTCSTKHALLKALADENQINGVKLFIGIFRMNGENTPRVKTTLTRNRLPYIPEAHCYLRYLNQIIDCTTENSKGPDFEYELMEETEIVPSEISDFKVNYHRAFLSQWLKSNMFPGMTPDLLWNVREQCIRDLSVQNNKQGPNR
jgi:hypothetical protein